MTARKPSGAANPHVALCLALEVQPQTTTAGLVDRAYAVMAELHRWRGDTPRASEPVVAQYEDVPLFDLEAVAS